MTLSTDELQQQKEQAIANRKRESLERFIDLAGQLTAVLNAITVALLLYEQKSYGIGAANELTEDDLAGNDFSLQELLEFINAIIEMMTLAQEPTHNWVALTAKIVNPRTLK